MFSNDRELQLNLTLKNLKAMNGFNQCQLTIVSDGKCKVRDYDVVQVPRIDKFCWADMWNAGVATAKHDQIWYLDSDRLLPTNYIELLKDAVVDDVFCFTSRHFLMLKQLDYSVCEEFLKTNQKARINAIDHLKYEPRFGKVTHTPKKNVMSGNTAFTKKTYYKLGGVDRWYKGHGAFADNDFHNAATIAGCKFIDFEVPELHCYHDKKEGNKTLTNKELNLLALENYKYYCKKWNLPDSYWQSFKV